MDEENQIKNALLEIKEELGSENISSLIDSYIEKGQNGVDDEAKVIVDRIIDDES